MAKRISKTMRKKSAGKRKSQRTRRRKGGAAPSTVDLSVTPIADLQLKPLLTKDATDISATRTTLAVLDLSALTLPLVKTLSITQNQSLTEVKLPINAPSLTKIIIENNPLLKTITIPPLAKVTELNIRQNPQLNAINISSLPNLQIAQLNNNPLVPSIDLSSSPSLIGIDVSNDTALTNVGNVSTLTSAKLAYGFNTAGSGLSAFTTVESYNTRPSSSA